MQTFTLPINQKLFLPILCQVSPGNNVSLLNYAISSPMVDVSSVCSSFPSLLQAICVGPENLQVMYPAIFEQLLLFVEFSCKPPQYGRMETKHVANAKYNQVQDYGLSCLTVWFAVLFKMLGAVDWYSLAFPPQPFSAPLLLVVQKAAPQLPPTV